MDSPFSRLRNVKRVSSTVEWRGLRSGLCTVDGIFQVLPSRRAPSTLPLNLPPVKRAVINLLNPTRRAPALKNNQIRLFLFHNLKSPQSPRLKFLSNIPAFSVYNLPLLNFRRSPGSRKPTQNFRTNLGHLMIRQKFHQPLIKIVPTVIFTIVAHKTGTDQDFHFRSSFLSGGEGLPLASARLRRSYATLSCGDSAPATPHRDFFID